MEKHTWLYKRKLQGNLIQKILSGKKLILQIKFRIFIFKLWINIAINIFIGSIITNLTCVYFSNYIIRSNCTRIVCILKLHYAKYLVNILLFWILVPRLETNKLESNIFIQYEKVIDWKIISNLKERYEHLKGRQFFNFHMQKAFLSSLFMNKNIHNHHESNY